jgi:hypothetical protein
MRRRAEVSAVLAILGLVAVVVYGCGGSSSSTTGPSTGGGGGSSGGSGAVVQGQLRTQTAAAGESAVVVVLEKILGIRVAEALSDGPVSDGTVVKLVPTGGGATLTTTTTGGAFHFDNVLPGEYTIQVVGFTTVLGQTTLVVGPGDLADVTGTANKDTVQVTSVHVTALATDEQGVLQNGTQTNILIRLAKAAGVSADTVLAMRTEQHMGWGAIAHAFGVHPSIIGGGHDPSAAEVDAFKASHGIGNGNGKGKGKGKA